MATLPSATRWLLQGNELSRQLGFIDNKPPTKPKTSESWYEDEMAEKSLANTIVKQERLCLADLVGRKRHEIISGELVVRVWKVGKVFVNDTGRQMQRVKLGDDKFTVDLTFWENDVKAAAALQSGMVVSLNKFTMDGSVEKGADQPLNISYRGGIRLPLTVLRILGEADIPPHLKLMLENLDDDISESSKDEISVTLELETTEGEVTGEDTSEISEEGVSEDELSEDDLSESSEDDLFESSEDGFLLVHAYLRS